MYPDLLSASAKAFIPQGFGFPLRYCRKPTRPRKLMTDSSRAICWPGVYADSMVGRSWSSSGWILDRLVVPSRSPTLRAPKIWKKKITGEDRPEEGQVRGVVSSPVVLDVTQLYDPHVEDNSNEPLHLLDRHRLPIPVEGVS